MDDKFTEFRDLTHHFAKPLWLLHTYSLGNCTLGLGAVGQRLGISINVVQRTMHLLFFTTKFILSLPYVGRNHP